MFTPTLSGGAVSWEAWQVPQCSFVYFWIQGGAGGGGGAFSRAAGVQGGGGGGGGTASLTRLIIPRIFLPDTIYMLIGNGGAGGAAGVAGSSGVSTFVCVQPDYTGSNNLYNIGISFNGGGGGAGSGTAGGTGGAAGPIADTSSAFAHFGIGQYLSGTAGTSGGTSGSASSSGLSASVRISEGRGGAGIISSAGSGGGVNASGIFPAYNPGANPGLDGWDFYAPQPLMTADVWGITPEPLGMVVYPGCGGGSQNATAGFNGGNGIHGSGGGGGGAGTTGGTGGKGGDGFVIATWW